MATVNVKGNSKKQLLNEPETIISELMGGLKSSFPGLYVDVDGGVIMLNRERKHRVALLSGGCAGHEPYAAGFVGENMLTAYVCGSVFSPPTPGQVSIAINNLIKLNKGGVLVFIPNYSQIILNFGIAIERARAKGMKVESVILADDISLAHSFYYKDASSMSNRRAVAGVVFAFKIIGAMSTAGRDMNEIVMEARCVGVRTSTMGVCLHPFTLPWATKPLFNIDYDKVSLDCGVHGEVMNKTMQMSPVREIVRTVLEKVLYFCALPEQGGPVCVLVNNYGGCTQLECFIIASEVKRQLAEMNIEIVRMYVGTLCSSLDAKGFHISILDVNKRTEWIRYLDLDTEAFAWPGGKLSHVHPRWPEREFFEELDMYYVVQGMHLGLREATIFRKCLIACCDALINAETLLNDFDKECGNGDTGFKLKTFSEKVIKLLKSFQVMNVAETFLKLAVMAEQGMTGSLGAIYSLLFMGAAQTANTWLAIWENAISTLSKYTTAKRKHRSIMDALVPALATYKLSAQENWYKAFKMAVDSAEEGCEETLNMIPKAGRAMYIDPSRLKHEDAGAYSVVVLLRAILDVLTESKEEIDSILKIDKPQVDTEQKGEEEEVSKSTDNPENKFE